MKTLADSRLAALWAKNYIWNVSATIRTIKNLAYSKWKWIEIPKNLKSDWFDDFTWDIIEDDLKFDYENLDSITQLNSLKIDKRKFAWIANQ